MSASDTRSSPGRVDGRSVPADRFYWAVLDPTPSPATLESFRYAFEPFVPSPIEGVHCRIVRPMKRAGSPVIACGVGAFALDGDGGAAMMPDALPAFVLERFDGLDESEVLDRLAFGGGGDGAGRRAHFSKPAALVVACLVSCVLLGIGMIRRADAMRSHHAEAEEALASLVAAVLGPPRGAEGSLPPAARLNAEARRLALTRSSGAESGDAAMILKSPDIAGDYIALLESWPADLPTRVEQIDLRASALTVRGMVRDAADFERLRQTLASSTTLIGYDQPTGSAGRARGTAGGGGGGGGDGGFTFDLAMQRTAGERTP